MLLLSKTSTLPRRATLARAYLSRGALACALLGLGSCALIGHDSSSKQSSFEAEVALPAQEAACLVAEALAYAYPNTQRDALRPIARAELVSADHWRIAYMRGGGGYLPLANGSFHRTSPAARQDYFELLPGLRFVKGRPCGPDWKQQAYVSVEITGLDADHARISAKSLDHDVAWGGEQVKAIATLLQVATELRRAYGLCRAGKLEQASECLQAALEKQRMGLSHVHDPLLANGFAALGILAFESGQLSKARRAFARGRLLIPASSRLLAFEARLRERLAQADRSRSAMQRAAQLSDVASLEHRRLKSLAAQTLRLADFASSPAGAQSLARRALRAGDAVTALSWSDRALDLEAGAADPLRLRASALQALGKHRSAERQLRLARAASPQRENLRFALATNSRGTKPALALRRILRESARWPQILDDENTAQLARGLGAEKCLRICSSEGVEPRVLRQVMTWFDQRTSPRARFLSRILTNEGQRQGTAKPMLDVDLFERLPDLIGAGSGIRSSKPGKRSAAPARPTR